MNQLKSNLSLFICLFSFITVNSQSPDSLLNINKLDGRKLAVVSTKDNYLFVYDGLYDMNGSSPKSFICFTFVWQRFG